MTDGQPATNVVEAWRRVLRDMPSIQKAERMGEGRSAYNFRSIEQFTAEAAQLCAEHGVIVIPEGERIEYVEVGKTQSGNVVIEARGTWRWAIYGPGGVEDVIHARSFGQGRDSSDKAANKAATSAFKYLLMPALMISDRKDDPDHERIETASEPAPTAEETAQAELVRRALDVAKWVKENDRNGTYTGIITGAAETAKLSVGHWIKANPEGALKLIEETAAALKTVIDQDAAAEAPQDKPKRAKPGSAVKTTEEAVEAVKDASPGTTEEAEDA